MTANNWILLLLGVTGVLDTPAISVTFELDMVEALVIAASSLLLSSKSL